MSTPPDRSPHGDTWTSEVPVEPVEAESAPVAWEESYGPVLAELGRGAIGRVVLVRDERLGREVARKELLANRPDLAARFVAEARITAQLDHPAIVPVYEIGRTAEGTPYYTMRRIRGRTLKHALRGSKTLAERLVFLPQFEAACQAMAYAHARGVVHRDLKTENVLLGPFGESQVVDWGIAKVVGKADDPLAPLVDAGSALETRVGAVLGTPAYMSPEQANGERERLDARTDVWGLGAILFEILTGRPPISGTPAQVNARALRGDVDDVLALAPDAPPELVAVVRRALARDPEERYPSAAALAEDVARFQRGAVVSAYAYSASDHLRRWAARNRGVVALGGLSVVAVLATAGVGTVGSAREAERARRAEGVAVTHEAAAVQALARGLREAALQRWRDRDDGEALLLAAASLAEAPDPVARGALVAAGSGWLPRLRWTAPEGTDCWVAATSPSGGFACRGPARVTWWPSGPDAPPLVLDAPFPHLRTNTLAIGAGGSVLGIAEPGGTRIWHRDQPEPGPRIESWDLGIVAPLEDGFWRGLVTDDAEEVLLVEADAEGRELRRVPVPYVTTVATAADGTVFSGTSDRDLLRIDPGASEARVLARRADTGLVAVTADGARVYTGGSDLGGERVTLRDADGRALADLGGPGGDLTALAVSPDGALLAMGGGQGANLVLTGEGEVLGRLPSAVEHVTLLEVLDGGPWIGGTRVPRAWELPADDRVRRCHSARASAVTATADGRGLAVGIDARLTAFPLDPGPCTILHTGRLPLTSLLVRGDAVWVGDEEGFVVEVRPDRPPTAPIRITRWDNAVGPAVPTPDGRGAWFGVNDGGVVRVEAAPAPTVVARSELLVEDLPIVGLALSRNTFRLYVLGRFRTRIDVLDALTLAIGSPIDTGACGAGRGLAGLPDGRLALAGSGGVCLLDEAGAWTGPWTDPTTSARSALAVSPDGRRLAAAGPANVAMWDTATGALEALVPVRGREPTSLAFDRAGRTLIVATSHGDVVLVDLALLTADPAAVLADARIRFGMDVVDGEVVETR